MGRVDRFPSSDDGGKNLTLWYNHLSEGQMIVGYLRVG